MTCFAQSDDQQFSHIADLIIITTAIDQNGCTSFKSTHISIAATKRLHLVWFIKIIAVKYKARTSQLRRRTSVIQENIAHNIEQHSLRE